VYCQASGTPITPTTLIVTVTASPYTLTTALEYNTTYYWMVVATNSYGDAVGSTVSSFTTAAPLNENFSGTFPPANWTRYEGVLDWVTTLTPNTNFMWRQLDWCNVNSPVNISAGIIEWGDTWLVTPPILMGGMYNTLELDIALTEYDTSNPPGATGFDDRFVILIGDGVSWSPANICRDWNNTGSPDVFNNIPYRGMHISISLDSYTGAKYVAFYASSSVFNSINALFLDNVQVTIAPVSVVTPTNVVIQTGTVSGTVTLSWDDMNAPWYGIYGGNNPESLTYLGWTGNISISLTGSSMGFYKVTSGSGTAPGSQLQSRETLPVMVISPEKPIGSVIQQRKNKRK
jgi:hypothetical protein